MDPPETKLTRLSNLTMPRSGSGIAVNETTAMRASAVYACVRLLAETIAMLPLHLFRRNGDSRQPVDVDSQKYRRARSRRLAMGLHNALHVNWAKIELRFRKGDSMAEIAREFGVLFWDGWGGQNLYKLSARRPLPRESFVMSK